VTSKGDAPRKGGAMTKVMAINGSPRGEKGSTAMILAPFLQGMAEAGAQTDVVYVNRLKIKPCDCGQMRCWFKHPGECKHKDDMQELLRRAREADILVLATPVYVPLPGDMQHAINRLSPLMDPVVENRGGRTRARFRKGVAIKKMVAVSTGGWWEKENFGTVVRIVQELAENGSVEFAGAVLRPHVEVMLRDGELTPDGEAVLRAVGQAGRELIERGAMDGATLEAISRPLVSEKVYRRWFNEMSSGTG
jgi:multimeric flavodoxin WrbA